MGRSRTTIILDLLLVDPKLLTTSGFIGLFQIDCAITSSGLSGSSKSQLLRAPWLYSPKPLGPFQNLTLTIAPSGNLGTDHDYGPLSGPSEMYGAPASLGFISDHSRTYKCLCSGWALFQAVPWVYLGGSQWKRGIVRLDSSDSLSLPRMFTATRMNHLTRLLRLFEPIWNFHSNEDESIDSTSRTS